MASKNARNADDPYGEQIDKLRQTFTRVSLIALTLLYFALTGFTTAMSRVDGEEADEELKVLQGVDVERLDASFVFSRRLQELSSSPGPKRTDRELVELTSKKLDKLASEWFAVKFQLLGTTVTVDLRYVVPVLPFLVILVVAYVWVVHRKITIIESVQVSTPASTPATAPAWKANAFRRHPNVLMQIGILLAAVALAGWLIYMFNSLREYVAEDVQLDYLKTVLCGVLYAILYVSDVTDFVSAKGNPDGWTHKLRRIVTAARKKMTPAHMPRPRGHLFSGAGLVLVTLTLAMATSCRETIHPGFEYAIGKNDAMWFNGDDFLFGSFTDYPMRPLYIASLVVSFAALVIAMLPWRRRSDRAAIWTHRARGLAAIVVRSTAFLAVCSICLFGMSDGGRMLGDLVTVAVWAGLSYWLWRVRKKPDDRARCWGTIGLILLPPALVFGPQAVEFLSANVLIGIPLLIAGCAVQFRVYRFLNR